MSWTKAAEEREFGRRMLQLVERGLDFRKVAIESLVDALGESPSKVIIDWIGPIAMGDPTLFAKSLERYFGDGTTSVCNSIEMRARESLQDKVPGQPIVFPGGNGEDGRSSTSSSVTSALNEISRIWRDEERLDTRPSMGNSMNESIGLPSRTGTKVGFDEGTGFGLDSGVWHDMKRSLYPSEDGRDLVRRVWRHYGKALGEKTWRMLGTAKDLSLSSLEDFSRDYGLGAITISGDVEHGTTLNVSIRDCAFCQKGFKAEHFPEGCEFAGLCEGFAQALYGKRTIVGIQGPDGGEQTCKFEIRRS